MEFLKTLTFFALLFMHNFLYSQGFKETRSAFKESYIAESKAKYNDAIIAIVNLSSPSCYECELRLGWLYYSSKKYAESIKHYTAAASLMPASTEALWGKVAPLTALEKWDELANTYKLIIGNDPKNTTANYRLGLYYYYKKDYPKSHKYFETTLNVSPFDYNTLLMDAWSQYFLGNKNEAKILFQKVLISNTEDVSALEGLSLIK